MTVVECLPDQCDAPGSVPNREHVSCGPALTSSVGGRGVFFFSLLAGSMRLTMDLAQPKVLRCTSVSHAIGAQNLQEHTETTVSEGLYLRFSFLTEEANLKYRSFRAGFVACLPLHVLLPSAVLEPYHGYNPLETF